MIDPIDPSSVAKTMRMVLAHLEDDIPSSVDAVSRILSEIDSGDGALDTIMLLLTWLCHEIDSGGRREAWLVFIRHRLVGDIAGVPDTIPDSLP